MSVVHRLFASVFTSVFTNLFANLFATLFINLFANLIAAVPASGRAQAPETATVQLPTETRVTDAVLIDVDGDHAPDLILACRHRESGARSLRVHLRQANGPTFVSTPSRPPQPIDRDVVAFTYLECLPAPGLELVLILPEQVVAVVVGADGAPTYTRLAHHRLVWPAADPDKLVPLPDAAKDFDADGRTDLLLPSPNGWAVLLQDTNADGPTFARRVERMVPQQRSAIATALQDSGLGGDDQSFELRLGSRPNSGPGRRPLVSASRRSPRCKLLDIDGDGRLDLAMHRNGQLYTGLQHRSGELTPHERPLPLAPDRLQLADPAFSVQLADINGDGRADLVLTTSARRDDDVEARVDLFRAREDGGWPAKPDLRLRVQALAAPPQLVDIDGDGRLDLACLSLRTSAMRAFTGDIAAALDAQLSLFQNDGTEFEKLAWLLRPLPLAAGEGRFSAPFLHVRPGANNQPGCVLLHIDGGVERRPLLLAGERLRLGPAAGRVAVPDKSRLVMAGRDDGKPQELLILTDGEVQHVRFR